MTNAIFTVLNTATISVADLLELIAESLAESACTCRTLPTGSAPCRACREAHCLARHADQITDRAEAAVLIIEASGNSGVNLSDLLPGIVEAMLTPDRCACDGAHLCPVCSAARDLDRLHRGLRAA